MHKREKVNHNIAYIAYIDGCLRIGTFSGRSPSAVPMSCPPEIQGPLTPAPRFLPYRLSEKGAGGCFRLSLSPAAESLARGGGDLANPDVIAAIVVTISADQRRRQIEMRGTCAVRRGNTVVTEPQRQRIPIDGECHGLPDSASASPSSSVSASRNAWYRHPGGLTNCPFTSGLPRFAPPASAGWMQACLGPRSGLRADTTSQRDCQCRKVKGCPV
jgi:hypothetical protein